MVLTPRLFLYEPINSEVVNVLTAIDDQLTIIDDSAITIQTTSSTHPTTNNYAGRLVYDSDTKELMRGNAAVGTVWQRQGAENRPRGKIGFITTSATSASVAQGVEIGPLLSLTFDALSGRTYLANFGGSIDVTAGNDAAAAYRIRKANGNTVSTTSTLVATFAADANDNTTTTITRNDGFCKHVASAGQITIGLFLVRPVAADAKTVVSTGYQYLAIEDVD